MTNSMNRDVAEVFDTYVYRVGIQSGQFSYSTAVGLFKSVIGLSLVLLSVVTLFPFVNVIAGSFSTSLEILERPFMLFPYKPTLISYRYIFPLCKERVRGRQRKPSAYTRPLKNHAAQYSR